MAQVYRLDVTKQNCWLCDHFRRNDIGDPNTGTCTYRAPRARSAIAGGTSGNPQDLVCAAIAEPNTTYCGDFKKWMGTAREIIVVVE